MTTGNLDAAKEVYTAQIVSGRAFVSGAGPLESEPTLSTDGASCLEFNILAVRRHHNAGGTSQYELWYYDGFGWWVEEDSSLLDIANYDPAEDDFFQQFNVSGIHRYKFRMMTATVAGTVSENLQI